MPTELASETVRLLIFLLPGLTAAWIFYGLTSHPKPPQFERVLQALIFTFVVHALLPLVRFPLLLLGKVVAIGPWDDAAQLLASLLLATAFGIAVAYITNHDSFHRWLRTKGFTSRTSHPSEWFCVFDNTVTFVILHLHDGRRLYGWPKEWPVDPDKGQFYIQLPSWIDENHNEIALPELNGILVQSKDVSWVEFLNLPEKKT